MNNRLQELHENWNEVKKESLNEGPTEKRLNK